MSRWRGHASRRISRLLREMVSNYRHLLLVRLTFAKTFADDPARKPVDLELLIAVERLLKAPSNVRLDAHTYRLVELWC